ncbi:MAG: 30S ribosomal protein S6 [Oligoflexia bacterium]|nr:30S ribosomal protein S6 [Oligoflexia bacterium]
MPSYETTIITKPAVSEDQVQGIRQKVESIVKAHKGQIGIYEDWGTRKLMHTIQKENRGRYIYFGYVGNTETVAELERNLRINEDVVRYLSIATSEEDDLELAKRPSPMKRRKDPVRDDQESMEDEE